MRKFHTWSKVPVSLNPYLSVVIPTFNEAQRLVPTIGAIAAHLAETEFEFEIIVSDDGSTDETVAIVRRLRLRNLVILQASKNRGKGAAVKAGILASRGDYLLITDADLSTPIAEVFSLLAATASSDIVIGSRAMLGSNEVEKSRLRKATSWGARRVVKHGLGLSISDSQCGFKLFSRRAALTIFDQQRIQGFSFDAEVLYLATKLGYKITEHPVEWTDAPGSTVCPIRTAIRFIRDIMLIRIRSLRGLAAKQSIPARLSDPERSTNPTGIRLAVVSAVPPSTATLTEYGDHLVKNLSLVPEVSQVIVLAEDGSGIGPDTKDIAIIPSWRFNSCLNPLRILRAVHRVRPDAVLFNAHFTSFGGRPVPAALGLLTPALVSASGTKTIVLLHNLVDTVDLEAAGFNKHPFINHAMVRAGRLVTRVVLRADMVVTTMPAYVDILRNDYGASNVALTPHASFETAKPLDKQADPTSSGSSSSTNPPAVLTFGKFGTYKKVEGLIQACSIVREQAATDSPLAELQLIIAGTDSPNALGYLDQIQSTMSDKRHVHFTGYVPEDEVARVFSSSSVVVFPYTATTGSSGPLHQAGSYGRATIVPFLGDFIQLLQDEGFQAETFQPDNPESLALALEELLTNHDKRHRMELNNYAAAAGLPMCDIAEWHVAHIEKLLTRS